MADIISEIQQYQNQPYCLHECPEVREFLENLDPFPEWADKEIDDYLWEKSCEIEPSAIDRSVDPPVRRRVVSKIICKNSHISQWARKIIKVQAKKVVKSNKSTS